MLIQTRELLRACAMPHRAWNYIQRWRRLARCLGLPFTEVMSYRRELLNDAAFQAHIETCFDDIDYYLPQAAELYVAVRAERPQVVVETGVSGGISSAHILRALAANGRGSLHSIDLPNVQHGSVLPPGRETGWMVPDELRGRWSLTLGDARELLPGLLDTLDRLDIFLHDSDHSYGHMLFEYELAFPRLEPGGLLMSDDTHNHSAWDDFCAGRGLRPGRVGTMGITRKERSQ